MRKSFGVLTILAALVAVGCDVGRKASGNADYADEEYQAQVDDYNRQTEQMDRILERQEAELEQSKSQTERYEKLLSKWEEQARRADAILDADEKKAGIKP